MTTSDEPRDDAGRNRRPPMHERHRHPARPAREEQVVVAASGRAPRSQTKPQRAAAGEPESLRRAARVGSWTMTRVPDQHEDEERPADQRRQRGHDTEESKRIGERLHGSHSGVDLRRIARRADPGRQLLRLLTRAPIGVAQVRLERVIADVEHAAGPSACCGRSARTSGAHSGFPIAGRTRSRPVPGPAFPRTRRARPREDRRARSDPLRRARQRVSIRRSSSRTFPGHA